MHISTVVSVRKGTVLTTCGIPSRITLQRKNTRDISKGCTPEKRRKLTKNNKTQNKSTKKATKERKRKRKKRKGRKSNEKTENENNFVRDLLILYDSYSASFQDSLRFHCFSFVVIVSFGSFVVFSYPARGISLAYVLMWI